MAVSRPAWPAEFPLAEAAAGMRFAERRGVVGKVVLTSGAPR